MTNNNPHSESDNKQQDVPSVPAFSEEVFLARMAEAQEQFRKQHPELPESDTDLKLSTEWWKPMFDLNTVVDKSLPKDVNDKLQTACKEFASAKYSREALDRFAGQTRDILAGFDEVIRLLESTILKDPGVWDKMHEHAVAKEEKGGE